MTASQALVPVQVDDENEGVLRVRGQDLLRFMMSTQKTGKRLDAESLQKCLVKTDAVY
jgi:hypothetical protein